MRINLVTPFAEKDAVKALGARWDSSLRTWYVVNVADLTPFSRWIARADGSDAPGASVSQPMPRSAGVATSHRPGTAKATDGRGTVTVSTTAIVRCGCAVLPWEPCHHN